MATNSRRSSASEQPRHASEPGRVAINHMTVVPEDGDAGDEE